MVIEFPSIGTSTGLDGRTRATARFCRAVHEQGKIKACIHASDFIEDATLTIQFNGDSRYTHAILDPPCKTVSIHSSHRKLLRMAGIETVNLYAAFVALAVLLMKEGGETVANPRQR